MAEILKSYIRRHGPILTYRYSVVSQGSYRRWRRKPSKQLMEYEIRLTKKGYLTHHLRASHSRNKPKATIKLQVLGKLNDEAHDYVLSLLPNFHRIPLYDDEN